MSHDVLLLIILHHPETQYIETNVDLQFYYLLSELKISLTHHGNRHI